LLTDSFCFALPLQHTLSLASMKKRAAESKEQRKREKAQADKDVADMYKRRSQVLILY